MPTDQGQKIVSIRYLLRTAEETRLAIARHYADVRFRMIGAAEDLRTSLELIDLGSVSVSEISYGIDLRFDFEDAGAYIVTWAKRAGYAVSYGREATTVLATADRATCFDPVGSASVDWGRECHAIAVRADKLALHRQLESLLGRPVHRRVRFAPSMDIARGPGRSWARLARWSLWEKDVPHGLLQQPIIARRLEQTLLEGLLLAADHQYREALDAPPPTMRPAAVKRVMDVVRENPAEPYDAARLAEIAQVGLRTLQEAFRRHVGLSPMAYVQEVRLQQVRLQLRVAAPGTVRVSDVAYQWGFAHLGRFAQRYRARFGESPSQTLRAA
ncbi:AraC family transcriptional regulator [Streptomyces monticola]|uniref:AraC family transcriptional regulator n=1 Tax=Streptomyces monticola TaxID=2666263 RepID=A0ABW2JJG9_9ACTN